MVSSEIRDGGSGERGYQLLEGSEPGACGN